MRKGECFLPIFIASGSLPRALWPIATKLPLLNSDEEDSASASMSRDNRSRVQSVVSNGSAPSHPSLRYFIFLLTVWIQCL